MSLRAATTRLAAMDAAELSFRARCEAHKAAGRVWRALRSSKPDRRSIADLLDPASGTLVADACAHARRGRDLDAHHALAAHVRTRRSNWPLKASARAALTHLVRARFPDAERDARARADRLLAGRLDLLGYQDVAIGNPPDWHADPVHGRRTPLGYWASVPYLDPRLGDHKVIWEINRHQYFLALGCAYWTTGDPQYRATFVRHVEDWINRNPPLTGVNWSSMLELAFRTMSWTWAVEFFASAEVEDSSPWLVDLMISLDRQLTHVSRNLSRYFSPNTHLSGEALGLYAVSRAFPELRRSASRAAEGRDVLLAETRNQIRPDGGHAELSAHYHRYSSDFYLLALMVARAAGDRAADTFEASVRSQARYLRTIADERGRLPLIGDDDGGQLFRFGSEEPWNAAETLSVAASLVSDASLAVEPADAAVYWTLGEPPCVDQADRGPATWPSALLPDSGYFVSRRAGGHLIFDAGPHGFLNGGHAHSDALSVLLTVNGEPLFIDPGTATYTMDPAARDRFRSTRMHNTVVVDGRDHAEPAGPFHWRTRADARFLTARVGDDYDYAVAALEAPGRQRLVRTVLALHGAGWLIVDRIAGDAAVEAEGWWHLHPSWNAAVDAGRVLLESDWGTRLALASTAPEVAVLHDREYAAYAPVYGRVEIARAIRLRRRGTGAFSIATFVSATPSGGRQLRIRELDNSTFAIASATLDLQIAVPFPSGLEAQPSTNWPQPCIKAGSPCVE